MAAATTSKRGYETTGDALLVRPGRLIGFDLVNRRCPTCRKRMTLNGHKTDGCTFDHITACANGGGVVGNLFPLCASCNSSKGKKDLAEWLPPRLVAVGLANTPRGARRMLKGELAKIETIRAELTSSLIVAGIWTA